MQEKEGEGMRERGRGDALNHHVNARRFRS